MWSWIEGFQDSLGLIEEKLTDAPDVVGAVCMQRAAPGESAEREHEDLDRMAALHQGA